MYTLCAYHIVTCSCHTSHKTRKAARHVSTLTHRTATYFDTVQITGARAGAARPAKPAPLIRRRCTSWASDVFIRIINISIITNSMYH